MKPQDLDLFRAGDPAAAGREPDMFGVTLWFSLLLLATCIVSIIDAALCR